MASTWSISASLRVVAPAADLAAPHLEALGVPGVARLQPLAGIAEAAGRCLELAHVLDRRIVDGGGDHLGRDGRAEKVEHACERGCGIGAQLLVADHVRRLHPGQGALPDLEKSRAPERPVRSLRTKSAIGQSAPCGG